MVEALTPHDIDVPVSWAIVWVPHEGSSLEENTESTWTHTEGIWGKSESPQLLCSLSASVCCPLVLTDSLSKVSVSMASVMHGISDAWYQ